MVKVIYGRKGIGKTKMLVEAANALCSGCNGDVVFIDTGRELLCDLHHKIRFIDVSEFPLQGTSDFISFICGIASQNYDIHSIFIDRLTRILKLDISQMEDFFKQLHEIGKKHGIQFHVSVSGNSESAPEYLKEYIA